jgi:CRP/FNR family transcriptional regulator
MGIVDQIAAIPLFEGLPGEQLRALAGICLLRTYRKGQMIFADGDEGIGFYIVQSGSVRIFKLSPEGGKEQILHIFSAGESFGEAAVFAGQGFPAFAKAQASSVLIFFPRVEFMRLVRRDPSLSLNMLAVLSRRLQKFARLIEDLSLKETPARLAAHLLYLGGKRPDADVISLEIPKGQMAALLGTIPETLSRIMARMGRQGLIRLRGNQISILDRTGLQQIASGEQKLA